jgi:hypothetical protein
MTPFFISFSAAWPAPTSQGHIASKNLLPMREFPVSWLRAKQLGNMEIHVDLENGECAKCLSDCEPPHCVKHFLQCDKYFPIGNGILKFRRSKNWIVRVQKSMINLLSADRFGKETWKIWCLIYIQVRISIFIYKWKILVRQPDFVSWAGISNLIPKKSSYGS